MLTMLTLEVILWWSVPLKYMPHNSGISNFHISTAPSLR